LLQVSYDRWRIKGFALAAEASTSASVIEREFSEKILGTYFNRRRRELSDCDAGFTEPDQLQLPCAPQPPSSGLTGAFSFPSANDTAAFSLSNTKNKETDDLSLCSFGIVRCPHLASCSETLRRFSLVAERSWKVATRRASLRVWASVLVDECWISSRCCAIGVSLSSKSSDRAFHFVGFFASILSYACPIGCNWRAIRRCEATLISSRGIRSNFEYRRLR